VRGWRQPGGAPWPAAHVTTAVLCAALYGAGGCSYTFNESSLPAGIRTVAIPVVDNATQEPGLEQEVTEAISSVFVDDGTLRVVPEAAADAALYGTIQHYTHRVFGFNAAEQTEEYEVILEMRVEFIDLAKRKSLWTEDMVGRTTYFVVETTGQAAQDEISGRREAIARLADDILVRTVRSGREGWN